jgi:predicted MFS family arabinose efflux permease
VIALVMVVSFYRESVEHSKHPIDWLGAGTLLGAVISLMFALELGGKEYAWNSALILGLFAAFAVLAVLFLFAETKAKEPIISFALFRQRLYASSILCALFSGAAFIAASVYIPIFIQGVLGGSATNSGLVLLPMMVASVITASTGGFLMAKTSYRSLMVPTLALLVLGTGLVATLAPDASRLLVTLYMILIGLGVGASFSVLSTAAIHGLTPQQRGSASATLNFIRSLGMTIGITAFGIIQSHYLSSKLTEVFTGTAGAAPGGALDFKDPHALLSPETRAQIPPEILSKITDGLSFSITSTFAWAALPALLALLAACFMGRQKMDASAEGQMPSGH